MDDIAALQVLAGKKLQENGIDSSHLSYSEELVNNLTKLDLERLCKASNEVSILACSVLGSFLAQEVVKCVSRLGKPQSCIFLFDSIKLEVKGFPNSLELN